MLPGALHAGAPHAYGRGEQCTGLQQPPPLRRVRGNALTEGHKFSKDFCPVNSYCKFTRAMTLRIFGRMWQNGARSSPRRRRKSRRWGPSLSLSLSLSHSLSCLLTHYSACPYTQAKSVAASSSWTIVRIWFGITNKLRITGASTKVLTAVTIYYCPLFTEKKIYSLPASTHTGGDCCHFYYTRSELIRDTRLTALYLLDFFVFFLLSRRQVSNVTQPRTSFFSSLVCPHRRDHLLLQNHHLREFFFFIFPFLVCSHPPRP